MKLRRQSRKDSLDLLLDTMCNAFGGIVLLLVLVSALSSQERQNASGEWAPRPDELNGRIDAASQALNESLQYQSSLQDKTNTLEFQPLLRLYSRREELRNQVQNGAALLAKATAELQALRAVDTTAISNALAAEISAAEKENSELHDQLRSARTRLVELKVGRRSQEQRASAAFGHMVRTLRFPQERETGKRPMYMILQYGLVYPCSHPDLTRNSTTIKWTRGGKNDIARPIQTKGLHPERDSGELDTYFTRLPTNASYVVFCVFEDSFEQFDPVKRLALAAGLEYGWLPVRNEDGPLSFGATGHIPNPQ